MGQVIPSVKAPNLAREVVLGTGLPLEMPAHTVNRACASANQAIVDVALAILAGHSEAGIAGGAESLSDVPILHSRRMAQALVDASRARSLGGRLHAFAGIRPRDLAPDAPAIAEPSTGLTMGQSAEKMAKENGITREEQDRIALPVATGTRGRAIDDGPARAPRCAPVPCRPRYEPAGRPPTTWCAATRPWRRWPRCRPSSTGSTGRSPPATRRRSPTARPPCS